MVRTRIAPSPTGEDLHIGNIYTGLINWVVAKKNKGQFIIRIEDTDRERLIKGAEEKILDSLKKFGLSYDEGPDVGGPHSPYRQSERVETYKKYVEELIDKEAAYYCFCSKEKLEEVREKEQKTGEYKRHILICNSPSKEEAVKRIADGEKYVVRLKVPENRDVIFEDLIRGQIRINTAQVDDQILLKSDGFPTYHLAVVVDDHLMEISHVLRAEEWISSTPKHILLYEAFGWEIPNYAHVPLLRNSDKSKLSKRKNPVWASWYLEQGYLPEVILNFLSLMGWSHPEGKEIFPIEEFIEKFEVKDLDPVGPVFDLTKLEWMNGEYIRAMSDEELEKRLQEFLVDLSGGALAKSDHPTEAELKKVVPLVKERIKKLSDLIPLTNFLFEKPEYEKEIFQKLKIKNIKEVLEKIIETLESMKKPWTNEDFEKTSRKLASELDLPAGEVFQLIRIAISGQTVTPPLFESIMILGESEALNRLKGVLSLL